MVPAHILTVRYHPIVQGYNKWSPISLSVSGVQSHVQLPSSLAGLLQISNKSLLLLTPTLMNHCVIMSNEY